MQIDSMAARVFLTHDSITVPTYLSLAQHLNLNLARNWIVLLQLYSYFTYTSRFSNVAFSWCPL